MANMSKGIWIVHHDDTPVIGDTLAALGTEGTDYISMLNVPKLRGGDAYEMNISGNVAGVFYALGLGQFSSDYIIEDIATDAQRDLVAMFCQAKCQSATDKIYVFRLRDGTGASAPTLNQHFYYKTTEYDYLQCRIVSYNEEYLEEMQLYKLRVAVSACWD